ncbi:type II secretion system F family protein [Clostridium gasigenes]|uniref:type II secretion system F family protein n=1 Tax=Clostridium gasigenes TaxID=94869 RepID=UPI00143856D9|nr:type II secretion system F family protein [Clostridium gasigenes]NKF05319.1 pilus assembly protein [Clostridium gasigenes]QSW18772.1 type II secretion system F family protein [Clostridium gasigenes]
MKNFIKRVMLRPNNDSLAIIAENIGSLYSEGIPFLTILELLREMPLANGYKDSIYKIQYDIENGESFENALKKHKELFPQFFISMVSIGEKSGRLNESLKGIKEYYTKISSIKKIVGNALAYPCVLLVTMISLGLFLALFIIPSFFDLYSSMGTEMPKSCLVIYEFVQKAKENPLIIIIYAISWGIVIPSLVIKYGIKKYVRIPFEKISIIRDFYEYISISLLSIIVKSGINLSLGLNYCANSFSKGILNHKFVNINSAIIDGKTLSEALQGIDGYSKYTISIVKLGEASGSMDERLELLSSYLEKKSLEKINKILAGLQPALILVMAAIVLIFIMIFVIPLFGAMMTGAEG